MWKRYKKRLLSLVCIVCMLCTTCFSKMPALAENSNNEAITLENAPENKFTHWTFSDVGIPNGSFGERWTDNEVANQTTGHTLNMTLFQGKIKFPTAQSEFVIGQKVGESKYEGFRFQSNEGVLRLILKATSETTLATFDPAIAGTTLIGNENLEVAFSVEYMDVTNGLVDMKVGVFFDGKLYNGTYLTVQDVPEEYLKQSIRFRNYGASSDKWYAESIITLDTAPEYNFAHWTFSDVKIPSGSFGERWTDNEVANQTNGKSLDKTLFQGKVKFPTVYSEFVIGQKVGASKYEGFRFQSNEGVLKLIFKGSSETTLATFDPEIAGTTLIGNKNLEVGFSVEFTDTTSGLVDMKVGVFFNGRLYNGTYLTVTDVPEEYLKQAIRFKNSNTSVKWYAESIVALDTAPEKNFAHWTFSDVGVPTNKEFGNTWTDNEVANQTTGKSLDKTIFQGKIKFPTVKSEFIIGQKVSESKYDGFRFYNSGSELKLMFKGTSETTLVTFDPEIAGTTLIGNKDLEVAFSVEFTDTTSGLVDMKVGVFFDGRLYNGTYLTVADVPEEYLKQTVRFQNSDTSVKWYVESIIITLDTAPESNFAHWTFSDVNVPNGTFGERWTDNEVANQTNGKTLNKTLFQGKVKFPTVYSEFVIGQKVGASKYEGFRFYNSGSELSLRFKGTSETTLITFDPEIAGTTLIGNENLKVAFSVEFVNITDGAVTMKVGVFFDGRLYNDTYLTVKDVPEAYLTQTVRFKNSNTSTDKWYVESITDMEQEDREDITLENTPEKDFACWTFSDMKFEDQTLSGNLNWGDDYQEFTIGTSLDKTIFNGKLNFAADTTSFGNFYIGGASKNDTSKWRGFLFTSGDTADKLTLSFVGTGGHLFNASGDTGSGLVNSTTAIAEFDSTLAGTTLRGNSDLQVSLSVEYIEVTDTTATLQVGVFFDRVLYCGTYYTVKDVPLEYLNQNVRFYVGDVQANAIASHHLEQCNRENITLETAPEKDFACWTFSDLGIDNQKLWSHLNWGDSFKEQSISSSLDKTIFNGKVNFAADTTGFGNFYIGGASKNDNSKWRGFLFTSGNTTDKLMLSFVGPEGRFFNASGDTGSDQPWKVNSIAVFNSTVAGTTLRGNSNLQVSLSVEYTEVTDTTATLKLGVFFDGVLYNNTYYTVKDVPLEYLNQNVRFYVQGEENIIASQHLCGKVDKGANIKVNSTYEELTMHDFNILDTKVEKFTADYTSYRLENFCDLSSLDGTAFSVICNFPESGSARFSLGGSFWKGVYFSSTEDGRIEVGYVNTAGDARVITKLSAETAGVDALVGKDITIRTTFDITEKGNGKADMRMGIYVNGTLYDGTHYTISNIDSATMTHTMKVYVTALPFTIKSVPMEIDLSIYGFDNKTWKEKI